MHLIAVCLCSRRASTGQRAGPRAASRPDRPCALVACDPYEEYHNPCSPPICGGQIDGDWNAEHVREFQLILKLGVWLRSQIEKQTTVGRAAVGPFVRYEPAREQRRRPRHAKE